MTPSDARDILNCAAPYKLRLLLEKGDPSLDERSRTNCRTKSKWSKASLGPLEATKCYVKRIGNFVSAGSSSNTSKSAKQKSASFLECRAQANNLSKQFPMTTSHSEQELKLTSKEPNLNQNLSEKRHLSSGTGGVGGAKIMLDLSSTGYSNEIHSNSNSDLRDRPTRGQSLSIADESDHEDENESSARRRRSLGIDSKTIDLP